MTSFSASAIAIVADDLTGACDSAVAFAERGIPTEVMITGSSLQTPGVQAISTETRDVSRSASVETIAQLAESGATDRVLFKKIDSVFRGNTFVELAALAKHFPSTLVELAPAYPALGRVTQGGKLELPGAEAAVDLRAELESLGARVKLINASCGDVALTNVLQQAGENEGQLVLCDARTDDDLDRIVAAATASEKRVLWAGSGGLAKALARSMTYSPRLCIAPVQLEGSVVLLLGSDHPATAAQVSALRSRVSVVEADIDEATHVSEPAVYLWRITRGRTTPSEISRAIEPLDKISCVLMTGGDTAMLACVALGVRSMELQYEFAHGVPQCICRGGVLDGKTALLKSGGFGEPDLLCDVVQHFVSTQRSELE